MYILNCSFYVDLLKGYFNEGERETETETQRDRERQRQRQRQRQTETEKEAGRQERYAWLSPVNTDKFMTYCKICLKSFRIDNSGLSQVKTHEKCHKPGQTLSNQITF